MGGQAILQSLYYWIFSVGVKTLGGLSSPDRLDRLAAILGQIRSKFGYIGSSKEDYLREFVRCLSPPGADQKRELLRRFWVEHQRRFLDLFLLPSLTPQNLQRLVKIENRGELDRLFQQGKGIILPVPHFGNVRLHHVALALSGFPVSVVSGDYHMEPAFVQRTKLEHESKLHQVGFLKQGTAWMIEALRRGDLLQIASTAEASAQGVWVTMLKRRLFLPTGWLRLSRMTGAPVLPTLIFHLPGGRYVIKILDEFPLHWTGDREGDLQNNAQRLMDLFSPFYQSYPEQVDWMYWLVRVRESEGIARNQNLELRDKLISPPAPGPDKPPPDVR